MDACLGVEPLERAFFPVVDAELGDQDPALPVHVDAVGRPALRTQSHEAPVRQDLGHGALVVGGEDAACGADDDVLRPIDADGDLLEQGGVDGRKRHDWLLDDVGHCVRSMAASTSAATAAKARPAARRAP